jgi:MoxR-like ATPase
MDNFQSTENYIVSDDLKIAVNAAIALEKPLLIKGEPGTGKTLLAFEIAKSLNLELLTWHIKSTTTAVQGLYEYDAVSRLRDSQLGNEKVYNIENYIKKGKLWQAFESENTVVLLIDEIDKADIEFPNDLLQEIDKMEFYCYELQKTIVAKKRPIIIITSNNEKELPDAFLRRCFFHFIKFPDRKTLSDIVKVHFSDISETLLNDALNLFYQIRNVQQLKKKPSTSELIDWIKLLIFDKMSSESFSANSKPPYLGALIKNEQDEAFINNYAKQIFGG